MLFKHISKCLIAGVVFILPIAGTVLMIAYMESIISSSGIAKLPFYFPGVGLLLGGCLIYILGLFATTFIGRWAWHYLDNIIKKLPALGKFYGSLKQILGYGEGDEAFFQEVVFVKSISGVGEEIGLVTKRIKDSQGVEKWTVFIPSAPNPTVGRMLILSPEEVRPSSLSVHAALKLLVSIGKSESDYI
ncbi:MAG: DUF502 domain-containing protein [Chlamydiota bacterium]|nr:DUF502 domain-containing protein [Chlamydiota bacterium]